jgi:two-component system copper resistance phosphate regulon response regulator CusR
MHIAVVEDNTTLQKSIAKVLKQEGFSVSVFGNGKNAFDWIYQNEKSCDLVILDILLPEMNGFEMCQNLREKDIKIPILILTSKDTVEDIVYGLKCGADDYLKKPFEFDELLARIQALFRRPEKSIREKIEINRELVVDLGSKTILKEYKLIHLTAKEFAILEFFLRNPNQVLTQQEIYDHVFDFSEIYLSNAIEVHIKNLRKKLKSKNYEIPIKTIRGAGYRFDL